MNVVTVRLCSKGAERFFMFWTLLVNKQMLIRFALKCFNYVSQVLPYNLMKTKLLYFSNKQAF